MNTLRNSLNRVGAVGNALRGVPEARRSSPKRNATEGVPYSRYLAALALLLFLALEPSLPAQDAPAEKPAPTKAPARAAPGKAAPAEAVPYRAPDPAVQTILDSQPTAPRDVLQAIVALNSLDRPDLAKKFIQQLLAAKLDGDAAAELVREFGSATLMKLSVDPRLQPDAQKLADQLLKATARVTRDPARLATRVGQLADKSTDVQQAAVASLREGGTAAVPPLLSALADPAQAPVHDLARQIVLDLGPAAVPPLAAALEAPSPAVKLAAIRLLGGLDTRQAALYLLQPYFSAASSADVRQAAGEALTRRLGGIPTRADAVRALSDEVRSYYQRQRVLLLDAGDNATVWSWDDARKRLTTALYPPQRASAFIAARLARDLYDLASDSQEARQFYLISSLAAAVFQNGLDRPLAKGPASAFQRAAQLGPDAVSDALAQALAAGHVRAAQAAAEVLGDIGSAKLLTRDGATPSPLVEALRSGDPRVRLAAARAVLKLKPTAPFAGSSYLTDEAAFVASGRGRHRIVIGFPTNGVAGQLAGLANALGDESVIANLGQDVLLSAAASADTELVLISGRIGRPAIYALVQQLHLDPRTATIPVGVMAELCDRESLERLFEAMPGVFVTLRPETPEEMQAAITAGVKLAGDRLIPADLRLAQAVAGLGWLADLAAAPPEIFDVRRYAEVIEHGLSLPETAPAAAAALARLGTHASQVALIDAASRSTQPLEVRQAAAAAFAHSVHRFGLRLAPSEVLRQYDRYNQSASLDKPTQQLLAQILDAIEGPTKALKKGTGTSR